MIAKLPIESSRAIGFGTYFLPTSIYEDTRVACHQCEVHKRGGNIINDGLTGLIEQSVMGMPFYPLLTPKKL